MKISTFSFLAVLGSSLLAFNTAKASTLGEVFEKLPPAVVTQVIQNECGDAEGADKDSCVKELKEQTVEVAQLTEEEAATEQTEAKEEATSASSADSEKAKKEKISVKSQFVIAMGLGLLDYGILGVEYNGVDQHGNLLFWAGADLSVVRQGTRRFKNEENISLGGYTSFAKKKWARGFGFGAFVTVPAYNGYNVGGGPEMRYSYNGKDAKPNKVGFDFFVRALFIPGNKEWDQHSLIIMPNFGIKVRFNCINKKK